MNFFDYIKNKLFPAGNDKHFRQPFHHEMLERKTSEKESYMSWKNSKSSEQLLHFIRDQYELSKNDMEDQGMMRVLSSPSSYGFMLRYPENISHVEFQHLFDLLKEKFLGIGYKIYASDRKFFHKENVVEEIQRHYLKPSYKNLKPPVNQLFGNISIELHLQNDIPSYLKFLCNNYSGAKYTKPLSYDELMAVIFKEE